MRHWLKQNKFRIESLLLVVMVLVSIMAFLPMQVSASSDNELTEEELDWIQGRNALYVGYFDDYMPYCGTDDNGKSTGLITDVFSEMIIKLGLLNTTHVELKAYTSYSDMVEAVNTGEVDAIFPAHEQSVKNDNGSLKLSDPVITSGMVLVYKGNYADDKYDTMAISANNGLIYDYVKKYFPESEIIYYSSVEKCLDAVNKGWATSTIINGLRIDIMAKNKSFSKLSMLQLHNDSARCIGVNNSNEILLSIINKGLASLEPNYAYSASYKYISDLYKYSFWEILKANSGWIVIGVLIITIMIMHFMIRDAKKNKDKEKEIQSAIDVNLALSKDYLNVFLVHTKSGTVDVIKMEGFAFPELEKKGKEKLKYEDACAVYVKERVFADDVKLMTENMKMENVLAQLKKNDTYTGTYRVWLDCAIHYYEFKCVSIGNSEDFIAGFQIVDDLIAEEMRQNELLKAANEAKTTFLFNMSHDIRTPMNAIIGFTSLLEEHLDDKERAKEYIQKIKTSSDFLLSLMNNVLEMAKIESGKYSVEENYWNAQAFNDNLSDVFGDQLKKKNIEFTRTVNITHDDVLCDATKLREIFLNIIGNSLKFTPEGGKISMDLEEIPSDRPGYAMYKTVISDNGIGISEEFLPHIFEEFTRERNTTESKINGTGMGMPIVKKLVEIMGGSISIESKVGYGTAVTVVVPHKIASELDKQNGEYSTPLTIEKGYFKGKRILLAEDNDLNAEIAIAILEEYGFGVDRAVNGEECVDKLTDSERGFYDLILMDIQMPVMNGYQATEQIRILDDPVKRGVPIIAMTANTYEEDRQHAYSVGMNGHIAKPIKTETLIRDLKDILE